MHARRRTPRTVLAAAAMAAAAFVAPGDGPAQALAASPSFEPYQAYPTGSWPESVVIGDFTGDGRADAALSTSVYGDSPNNSKVLLFSQQADGTLAPAAVLATDGQYGDDMGLAAGDLNGDGLTDLALATEVGVDVFLQRGGTLAAAQLVSNLPARQVEIADITGDGWQDVVVNGGGVQVLPGTGTAVPAAPVAVTADILSEVEVGDVTGDGRLDVVGFTGKTVKVYAQAVGGTFGAATGYEAVVGYWTSGAGLEVADLTGDGRADVALSIAGNRPGALVNVFAQQADGTLAAPAVHEVLDVPEPLEAADLTGDGRADLVTAHGGWDAAGVLVQQPDGTLGPESTYALPYASHYNPKGLALGDLDGDGRLDVAVADYNNGLVVLRQGDAPPPPTTTTTTTTSSTTTTTVPSDTDPPETTITRVEPEGTVVYGDSVTFWFESDDSDSTFGCQLDGAVRECTSPVAYTGLAEGTHTFQVAAVDAAGNADTTPATWQFRVAYPTDLAVAMVDSPDPVRFKAQLTYTVTVTNQSKVATAGVVVEHRRPDQSTLVGASSSQGTCGPAPAGSTTTSCSLGTLAPGASATVRVTVKVTAPKGSVLEAVADVRSDRVDSDPGDDTARATTTVGR